MLLANLSLSLSPPSLPLSFSVYGRMVRCASQFSQFSLCSTRGWSCQHDLKADAFFVVVCLGKDNTARRPDHLAVSFSCGSTQLCWNPRELAIGNNVHLLLPPRSEIYTDDDDGRPKLKPRIDSHINTSCKLFVLSHQASHTGSSFNFNLLVVSLME
jgi:hypothetical protein